MKLKYIAAILLLGILLYSCDQIEPPYDKKGGGGTDTGKVQRVLLEEYTGYKCGNCPEAADKAHLLASLYPGRVIIVAIHAGFFAKPTTEVPYDFRTTAGEALDGFFQVSRTGFPKALINRKEIEGKRILTPGDWDAAILGALSEKPDIDIVLQASYSGAENKITINADVEYLSAGKANHRLSVFIIEDNVVQFQTDDRETPPEVEDFNHRDVLRAAVNDTWGEPLSDTDIASGRIIKKNYDYIIEPVNRPGGEYEWNPANLKIVAFVHDFEASYKVLQAAVIKLSN